MGPGASAAGTGAAGASAAAAGAGAATAGVGAAGGSAVAGAGAGAAAWAAGAALAALGSIFVSLQQVAPSARSSAGCRRPRRPKRQRGLPWPRRPRPHRAPGAGCSRGRGKLSASSLLSPRSGARRHPSALEVSRGAASPERRAEPGGTDRSRPEWLRCPCCDLRTGRGRQDPPLQPGLNQERQPGGAPSVPSSRPHARAARVCSPGVESGVFVGRRGRPSWRQKEGFAVQFLPRYTFAETLSESALPWAFPFLCTVEAFPIK